MRLRHYTPIQRLEYFGYSSVEEFISYMDRCKKPFFTQRMAEFIQKDIPVLSSGRYTINVEWFPYFAKLEYVDNWKYDSELIRIYKKHQWDATHKVKDKPRRKHK